MMDMLKVFFEKTDTDTSSYFLDKKINKCGNEYMKYQGKFPVIFLTFKDLKSKTWSETKEKIKKMISIEFLRHSELKNSNKLNEFEKETYINISKGLADDVDFEMSLQLLSLFLYKHYDIRVVIIIDEYVTPIQQGNINGFYNETIDFMRSFFSAGLKDNPNLEFGFLTGILRVAKESIFSGLNNLKINSILDDRYSQYFGFTKEEVKELLSYYGYEDKFDEISSWYDGYLFGNTEIYNPWSVINYVDNDCNPQAFWLSTSSNDIINKILNNADKKLKEDLYTLLVGNKITTYIDTNVIYPEINHNLSVIYSFLLVSGYLKIDKKYAQIDGNFMCDIKIPNKEIFLVYKNDIIKKSGNENTAIDFQTAIFQKDINKLQKTLEKLMIETISSFDTANEAFYHGMLLGILSIVSSKYRILSNRESGLGRFDIELIPLSKDVPAFIFEIKNTKDVKEIDTLPSKALNQI